MEKGKKRRIYSGFDKDRLEANIEADIARYGWQEVEQTITSNNPQWVIEVLYFEKERG